MSPRDQDIIAGVLRGDPSALRVLDGWTEGLLRERFRSLETDIEDVRQEVRLRVFDNLRRGAFDGRSSLFTYAYRIARNVCVDFARQPHRRRETDLAADARDVATMEEGGDPERMSSDLLERALSGLSASDLLLVRLVLGERRSYSEVARRMGIPEGTVKSRVWRCKDRLVRRCRDLSRWRDAER